MKDTPRQFKPQGPGERAVQPWFVPRPANRLPSNLESVLSEPTQAALDQQRPPETQRRQVNRSNSYHAIKDQVLDLLYRDMPVPTVIDKLMKLFAGEPVAVRPHRQGPRRGRPSFHRSYHLQRRVKKAVF